LSHALLMVAYIFHVGAGMTALAAGFTALFVRKGGRLHRRAGTVFVSAMLVMAIFAGCLALVLPDQLVNLFIAFFTLYLLATGWMAVRQGTNGTALFNRIALCVATCLSTPFLLLSFQLATRQIVIFQSAVGFKGPIVVAIYSFTVILVLATLGDAKVVFGGGISGAPRIVRHLWRLCIGLTLATGSAFTNGFARLLPGPYHVPALFFYPQFVPLALMFFWIIRVRFSGWINRNPVAAPEPDF
jgi:uncharacterized membrane protein